MAVTRYFGGVLLGTGGLVRAYHSAASAGLEASLVLERHEGFLLKAESDYDYFGKLKHTALNEEVVLYDVLLQGGVDLAAEAAVGAAGRDEGIKAGLLVV